MSRIKYLGRVEQRRQAADAEQFHTSFKKILLTELSEPIVEVIREAVVKHIEELMHHFEFDADIEDRINKVVSDLREKEDEEPLTELSPEIQAMYDGPIPRQYRAYPF